MADVGRKAETKRVAVAEAFVRMKTATLKALESAVLEKGDAFAVARVAGILATKKTADLIPLAHPIAVTHVRVDVEPAKGGVRIEAEAQTTGQTGVEMEALTAASVAALTIYDMAKKHDRGMVIERVRLLMKSGGRSGTFRRR
jgi:cyclic pyranopterin phosphate synthase